MFTLFNYGNRFGDAGICECLYDYILAWQDNVDMVIVLLIAAQNLALTALNRSRLGRAGVCKLILTAVNRYKTNEFVIEYGFMAIQKLALDEHNCFVMYEMNVSVLLVKTIRTFLLNESIIELGSMAIMNISASGNPEIVQSLEMAGVAECIATLLLKFVTEAEIIEYNLIAISNLAACSENPKVYGQVGVADSMAVIIKHYRQNEVILEQVCKTIVILLKNKENMIKLQQSNVPTTLSKTLVAMSRQDNKLRAMLERTKQMIKSGSITSLSSSGNQLLLKVKKATSPPSATTSRQTGSSVGSGNGSTIPSRQGPLRLERSSSSSVSSAQSHSSFNSHPTIVSHDGSLSTSLAAKNARTNAQYHTMTVGEVLNKIKKGIANIEEATTATCLRNIARMCEGNQVMQAEFGANGACKEVLEALSTFLNSLDVAENGLRAVCYLSRYGQDKSTANETNNDTFGQIKLPHMLVKTMQFHEDSEKVSLYGCKAIMNLGSCEANNDMLGDAGACEVVVSVLTKFSGIGIVLKQGLWAMINLALDKKNNARFTSSGCAMVVQILRDYTQEPDIAAWACMTVQNLCINKENQLELGSMEAVEMVVKTMEANLQDTMTIQFGLMAIEKLVQWNENSRRAGVGGACELVLRSLQMFHGNEMIIELCWKCMNRLCNQSIDNCYRFVDNNACVLLTSSLKKFSHTEEIVEQVLAAIGYLGGIPVPSASGGDSGVQYVRTILGNSGACEAVTFILTTYTSDEAIKRASQQQSDNIGIIFLCLQAIASLSINEEENRSRFGVCGACEKTIAAMTLHLGSEDIAIRGATVVLALGKHHLTNATKFTATGALTVMLRIIQKNSTNMNVVVMGFSAMTTVLTATSVEKESCSNIPTTERATVTFGANTKEETAPESISSSALSGGTTSTGRPTMRRDRRATAVGVWEDAGSYDVILKTLRMHGTNKEISGCGCQLLHSMMYVCASSLMSTSVSGSVGNGRGVNLPPKTISSIGDVIVKLLTTYNTSSTRVVSYSCQTISDMLADPRTAPKHNTLLGKLGLCDSLLTCLNYYLEHPKHVSVLEKILLALASLCADPSNRVACGQKGLCEQMVTLAYAQMETDSVVLCACRVLAALAGEASNQGTLATCEAGTLAMVVLEKHRQIGSIVAQVCQIVGALVQHSTTLAQLEALQVHVLLVTVLESHLHHASVTQEACQAMFHLSQQQTNEKNSCHQLIAAGAPERLLKVLVSHTSYYRPQTSLYACQTLALLCQVDSSLASTLHKGSGVNGRNVASTNTSIGLILFGILKGLDDYSPKNCHSSSTNRDLHEKVPYSSLLKRKQTVSLVSAVLTLLHGLAVQHTPVVTDLFPGNHEVASWVPVTTTSLKQIHNSANSSPLHQHDFFKLLACNILKPFQNDSSLVILVLQVMSLCFQHCPEAKRCFALQEKFDMTNNEDLWFPVLSDILKTYLSTRTIFLLSIEIMIMLFNSVVRSVVLHTPQLLTYLEVDGLVSHVIVGLSTYLTDTPMLLELTQLVYHISRVGQLSSSHDILTRDLHTHVAGEKLIRVLQVHQHDDEEHTSSASRHRSNSLTDTQVQAVQLCINCCECLGSMCEQSDEMNILLGSKLGFCELATKLLGTSVAKCSGENDKRLSDDSRGSYQTLLDVTSSTLAHLVTAEDNQQIALENQGVHTFAALLLSHYKIESIAINCCRAITYLMSGSDEDGSSNTSTAIVPASTTAPVSVSVATDNKAACKGIILALNFHIEVESVVRNACWVITHLATDPVNRRLVGRQGCGELLLRVLNSHQQDLALLELVLGAMINLIDHDQVNSMALFNGQVVAQMAALFETFACLQRDQHYVLCNLLCMVTINLTEASNVSAENTVIITAIGKTSIMRSLLTILGKLSAAPSSRHHTSAASVPDTLATILMKQGCWVLKNLTMQHPINSSTLGEVGASTTLVPVINSYIQNKNPEVVEIACAVLVSLLTVDMANYAADICNENPCGTNNLLLLTDAGGFDVAIQTLFAFMESRHTSTVYMACLLLYRFLFLTAVSTDVRASTSVSITASDLDRDYNIEDEQMQNALDSFVTIQHVMEEVCRRHASQSVEVTNRTLRVLRHLYFRTFRASPCQYRVFSTQSWTAKGVGNDTLNSSEEEYFSFHARLSRGYGHGHGYGNSTSTTKLPVDVLELRDHHRRLVLSDWKELSIGLGPLLLQHQESVSVLQQLLCFLTELCVSAAQTDIQSSLCSYGVIENILMVLRHYLEVSQKKITPDHATDFAEAQQFSLLIFEECGRCLVSLLEGHTSNKQWFLDVGGGQLLMEWLQYLLFQQAATGGSARTDTEDRRSAKVMAEKAAAVGLTAISRVLLTLLSGSDDSVATDGEEISCQHQLLALGVHIPLVQLCLSRHTDSHTHTQTLPLTSANIFVAKQWSPASLFTHADRRTDFPTPLDLECEVGSVFSPSFLFSVNIDVEASRSSGGKGGGGGGGDEELVYDEGERLGVSAVLACIHALDVLRLFTAGKQAPLESNTLFSIFNQSLKESVTIKEEGSFPVMLVMKLKDLTTLTPSAAAAASSGGGAGGGGSSLSSPAVLPMSDTYQQHLQYVYILASQELLAEYLLGYIQEHEKNTSSSYTATRSSSSGGGSGAVSDEGKGEGDNGTHYLAPLLVETLELLKHCAAAAVVASFSSSSSVLVSRVVVMVVQTIMTMTCTLTATTSGNASACWKEGDKGHCLVPPSSDEGVNRTARREVLLSVVSREEAFAVISATLECTTTAIKGKGKDRGGGEGTIEGAALAELKHYLLQG